MEEIQSDWQSLLRIIELVATLTTVIFAYIAIRTSKKIANDQIQFNKDLNNQEIQLGRPFLSCTGNISISNQDVFNLNIAIRNIGRRALYDLRIKYWALEKKNEVIEVAIHSDYKLANPLEFGSEQVLFERLPRTASELFIYYKIILEFKDTLNDDKHSQMYYYVLPPEQQNHLNSGSRQTIGLFGASKDDQDTINNNI